MPTSEGYPAVGDRIRSPKFAFGKWSSNGKFVKVDGKTFFSAPPHHTDAGGASKTIPTRIVPQLGYDAYDESRGTALFIVEHSGRGIESTPWFVVARRITSHVLDPNVAQERIAFFVTGDEEPKIEMEDIEIIPAS